VVHRDLKPENLFIVGDPAVTGGERAKLLDFGIAKLCGDEPGTLKTQTGMLIGTPVYMSPEQCRGAGNIDHRSDIYSLGCVLFCMLAGRPPFDGEGSGELIAAHLLRPAPTLSMVIAGLPPAIEAVVARCLAKSPGDRFQTMSELGQALAAAERQLHGIAPLAAHATGASLGRPAPWRLATTTLRVSSGEISLDPGRSLSLAAHKTRGGWIAGLLAASVVIGAAVFAVGAGGRHRSASATAPAAPPPPPAAAPSPPAAAPAPAVSAKAAAMAVAPIGAGVGSKALLVRVQVPAPVPAIVHVIDAGAPRASHVDTGRVRPAIRRPVAPPRDNAHATQVGAGSGTVDRGD
jgi:serine/threonine-protein kinase